MCQHLWSPDFGKTGDVVAENAKEDAVNTTNDLLFEGAVRGNLFSEDM